MDTSTVRIVCAVLAVLFLGIIVLRRKKGLSKPGVGPGMPHGRLGSVPARRSRREMSGSELHGAA